MPAVADETGIAHFITPYSVGDEINKWKAETVDGWVDGWGECRLG